MLEQTQPYGVPQLPDRSILYQTNADLDEIENQRRQHAEEAQRQPMILGLASYVRTCWNAAREAKEAEIHERMLKCLRQRAGTHDPDIAAAIKAKGGSNVYMMLTDEKCTATESWLEDILLPPDDKPWMIAPTPVPDLPGHILQQIQMKVQEQAQLFYIRHGIHPSEQDMAVVMQEIVGKTYSEMCKKARKEAERIEQEINDILQEALWHHALKEFLYYFVTFPVAYMKGPVLRKKPVLKWGPGGPEAMESVVKEYEVPSPMDIYPSPGARNIDDGYLIERHILTRSDLYALIGTNGYDDDAIREVLRRRGSGGVKSSWLWVEDNSRDILEGRHRKEIDPEDRIDALQFWGSVSGEKLMEWGGWPEQDWVNLDPERNYETEVWLIDDLVIKATINPDPLGRKPYFKASFRELYGQFYGKALPEVIRDSQLICNAAARNLVDNMAIASGPQVGVDASVMPAGEDYTMIYPWRVWPFDLQKNSLNQRQRDPVWFFQPQSLANELMAVYEKFSMEADTKSGIPRYSYGHKETGGPISTATGFSMMMNNAARGIKKVVRNIDFGVISPSILRLYTWLMLYDEEFRAQHEGDINIIARGSSALVVKEQEQMRLLELLQIVINSSDLKLLAGLPGVGRIFNKAVKNMNIGMEGIIPTDHELEIQDHVYKMQQMLQIGGGAGQGPNITPQSTSPNVAKNRDYTDQPVKGRDVRSY
jgi:hypothetical protein